MLISNRQCIVTNVRSEQHLPDQLITVADAGILECSTLVLIGRNFVEESIMLSSLQYAVIITLFRSMLIRDVLYHT